MKEIRYFDFLKSMRSNIYEIHFNDLSYSPPKVDFRGAMIILKPYIGGRLKDQLKAVVPISLYLFLFQIVILRQSIPNATVVALGLGGVIIGLMFFMEGLKLGLMPFGEVIGSTLPLKSKLVTILLIAFTIGLGATFAEPAIGVLKEAGKIVKAEDAPVLYALLNIYSGLLVTCVGIGVGLATVLGILRFLYNWSLKPLIFASVTPTLLLTVYAYLDEGMSSMIGLAWDCGGVTTGPVTVPLVLSLGMGVSLVTGKSDTGMSGFGIVTLASLFPIMAVLSLALYVTSTQDVQAIVAAAAKVSETTTVEPTLWDHPVVANIILAFRAILPLCAFLYLVQKVILREKIQNFGIVIYGIGLCVIGMIMFNLGLAFGLSALGSLVGDILPAAFTELDQVSGSPLYLYQVGIAITVLFAFIMGYGATLAEPALNALGLTVENITNGAFKKTVLMHSVCVGVACGLSTGILKVVFDIPLPYLLIPLYSILIVLTIFSSEKYVNIGWDCGGVTTGPVTVPLVLALGLGVGNAVNVVEGFGIISMASVWPIITVVSVGLWVDHKASQAEDESARSVA